MVWKNPIVTRYSYLAFICYDTAFFWGGGCISYVISMSMMTSFTVGEKMRKWSVWRFYNSIFFERVKKTPLSACFQILTYKLLYELGCEILLQNPNLCKTDVIDEVLYVLLCPFCPIPGHSNFCGRFSVQELDPVFFLQFNLTLFHRRILGCSKLLADIQQALHAKNCRALRKDNL